MFPMLEHIAMTASTTRKTKMHLTLPTRQLEHPLPDILPPILGLWGGFLWPSLPWMPTPFSLQIQGLALRPCAR